MRIEKRLKQEVEYTKQKILEDGQDIRENLIRDYCNTSTENTAVKPKKIKKLLWITASCLIVCLIVVSVCCITLLPSDTVNYLKDNEITEDISLEEFVKNIGIEINESKFTIKSPRKTNDSISQDLLYYTIQFESKNILPYGQISFSTNKNFSFEDKHEMTERCEWNNCEIKYSLVPTDVDGMPEIYVSGKLNYKGIQMFFNYTDIDMGDTVTPITFLDSLINL